MRKRYSFFIYPIIIFLIIFLPGCGSEEQEADNGEYNAAIEKVTPMHFSVGDTLELIGKNFGESRGSNYIVFKGYDVFDNGYAEVEESGYIFWTDTLLKIIVPDGANEGRIYINSLQSNGYSFELKKPLYVFIIEFLVSISLGITVVYIYLKINKIWKRKHEQEVADSQSLTGLFMYIMNCVLWVCYYAFVVSDMKSLLDTSVYIFEGTIFFLIGTGIFVRGQRREGLWNLIKRALNIERKEADYLWKKMFKPQNAEIIISILHQLAMIDEELDTKEQELIEAFAKEWNIDYSIEKLNLQRHKGSESNYIRLRNSLSDYLERQPPHEQVAQLKDMIDALIHADEKVTDEEELISSELGGLIENYLNRENQERLFHVIIVPQQPEHESTIMELMPEARKIYTAGGVAFSIGEFYSQKYADMICKQYRQFNLFTIIQVPDEIKKPRPVVSDK